MDLLLLVTLEIKGELQKIQAAKDELYIGVLGDIPRYKIRKGKYPSRHCQQINPNYHIMEFGCQYSEFQSIEDCINRISCQIQGLQFRLRQKPLLKKVTQKMIEESERKFREDWK